MKKLDLKQVFRKLYSASAGEVALVDVPRLKFLMLDGEGDPEESAAFQNAVAALYGVAYTLKFALKKSKTPRDYTVMPLEGLWWSEGAAMPDPERRSSWRWTLMILHPEFITAEGVREAAAKLRQKSDNSAAGRLRLEEFQEGKALQTLHVGPYSTENVTIARLHEFAGAHGLEVCGKHHEIYLGDPRRTAPERLKTILRLGVRERAGGAVRP